MDDEFVGKMNRRYTEPGSADDAAFSEQVLRTKRATFNINGQKCLGHVDLKTKGVYNRCGCLVGCLLLPYSDNRRWYLECQVISIGGKNRGKYLGTITRSDGTPGLNINRSFMDYFYFYEWTTQALKSTGDPFNSKSSVFTYIPHNLAQQVRCCNTKIKVPPIQVQTNHFGFKIDDLICDIDIGMLGLMG